MESCRRRRTPPGLGIGVHRRASAVFSGYQNVILPIIVIRRLECVLMDWREKKAADVLAKRPKLSEKELAKLVKELERQWGRV